MVANGLIYQISESSCFCKCCVRKVILTKHQIIAAVSSHRYNFRNFQGERCGIFMAEVLLFWQRVNELLVTRFGEDKMFLSIHKNLPHKIKLSFLI